MRARQEYLFSKGDLQATLDNVRAKAVEEVEALDGNQLLQVSETDLVAALMSKYCVEPVVIKRDDICVTEPTEVEMDVSSNPRYFVMPGEKAIIKGVAVSVVVPFQGNEIVLRCQPQRFSISRVLGRIVGQEIYLDYEQAERQGEELKKAYEYDVTQIDEYLRWGADQVRRHNEQLETAINESITKRKQRLLANQGLVASLGLPLKRRDMPATYSIPMTPRKPKIEMPKAVSAPFKPEPALSDEDYEYILGVIQNVAVAMERSPRTFAKLDEEEIRDHFVVHLNGHYEGQTTGETFNYEGKTDILIRVRGKNVFIGECAIWRGEAYLTEKIDQILSYASWRDTKTAILVFSRNKAFSGVLEKIRKIIKAHPNFKKELRQSNETQFRYLFHHRDDKNRELKLAILAFAVPGTDDK